MRTLFCSVTSLGFCCQLFVGACDGLIFFRHDSLAFWLLHKVTLEDVCKTTNNKLYKNHSDGLTKQITLDCYSYNAYKHACTFNAFWGHSPWASWWLFIDGLLLSLFEIALSSLIHYGELTFRIVSLDTVQHMRQCFAQCAVYLTMFATI